MKIRINRSALAVVLWFFCCEIENFTSFLSEWFKNDRNNSVLIDFIIIKTHKCAIALLFPSEYIIKFVPIASFENTVSLSI